MNFKPEESCQMKARGTPILVASRPAALHQLFDSTNTFFFSGNAVVH
jgi:hypothetical protein